MLNLYLKSLEFDRIILKLSTYFSTVDSAEYFSRTRPNFNPDTVRLIQNQVYEISLRMQVKKIPNFEYMESIRGIVPSIKKRVLHLEELSKIRVVLHNIKQYDDWLQSTKIMENIALRSNSDKTIYSKLLLRNPASIIGVKLNPVLSQYIDKKGTLIRDSIPQLKELDNKKTFIQKKRQEVAQSFIATHMDICMNTVPTLRNGRVVIPINVSHKNKIEGIIHGSSGTSQTVFIEVKNLYEHNNELDMLGLEEQKIVYDLCKNLTDKLAEYTGILQKEYSYLIEFDVLLAQYQYSRSYEGVFPQENTIDFNPKNTYEMEKIENKKEDIYLPDARHPFIENCVPITIKMDSNTKQLILTGPNAGGKTVALKTLGLLVLMSQSGIPIPVAEDACIPIFKSIKISIGDNQNISEGESSFSSQMRYIYKMMPNFDEKVVDKNSQLPSLLLFDELCSGTDDQEGGALAWAILEYILQTPFYYSVVTTHSTLLKHYALTQAQVQIAALEHNTRNQFKIVYGLTGSSESYRVATKIGFAKNIISRQASVLQEYGKDTHSLMKKLQTLVRKADNNSDKTQKILTENKNKKTSLIQWEQYLTQKELQIREKNHDKSIELLRNMHVLLEKITLKEKYLLSLEQELVRKNTKNERENKVSNRTPNIMKNVQDKNIDENIEPSLEQLRVQSKNFADCIVEESKIISQKKDNLAQQFQQLKVGDEVLILKTNIKGVVVAIGDDEKYTVRAGIVTLTLDRDSMQSVHEASISSIYDKEKISDKFIIDYDNSSKNIKSNYIIENVNLEIGTSTMCVDIRGKKVQESIDIIDKQLDRAIISKLNTFSIIHGKGNLANAIHTMLRTHELVLNYKYANPDDGGQGKTYVYLE